MVVSTLMPISRAASGSWAVARMALPMRLRVTNPPSRSSSGTVTAIASTSPCVTETPATSKSSFWDLIRSGAACCAGPSQRMPTFWRMNENPTAVISGASLGALRNGR